MQLSRLILNNEWYCSIPLRKRCLGILPVKSSGPRLISLYLNDSDRCIGIIFLNLAKRIRQSVLWALWEPSLEYGLMGKNFRSKPRFRISPPEEKNFTRSFFVTFPCG